MGPHLVNATTLSKACDSQRVGGLLGRLNRTRCLVRGSVEVMTFGVCSVQAIVLRSIFRRAEESNHNPSPSPSPPPSPLHHPHKPTKKKTHPPTNPIPNPQKWPPRVPAPNPGPTPPPPSPPSGSYSPSPSSSGTQPTCSCARTACRPAPCTRPSSAPTRSTGAWTTSTAGKRGRRAMGSRPRRRR